MHYDVSNFSLNYPFGADSNSNDLIMLLLNGLPPLPVQQAFVSHYMETIEKSYHLLDGASWEVETLRFWSGQSIHDDLLDFDWLAQYFMVLSLGCQAQNFISRADGARTGHQDLPSKLLKGAELCLRCTHFMLRPSLGNIRTLCLVIISKQIYAFSCQESDTCWPLTGLTVRLAISKGLHMSEAASREGRLSRRLWTAVVFLDMRQSLICGMPLLLPSNIFASFVAEPRNDPLENYPSPYSDHNSAGSASERALLEDAFAQVLNPLLEAIQIATGTDVSAETYARVVETDAALRRYLKGITSSTAPYDGPALDFEYIALAIFIRQALFVLHTRFALHPASSTAFPLSSISCLESALALLSLQRDLCEGEPRFRRSVWFSGLFWHEFFISAVMVCCQLVRGVEVAESRPGCERCVGEEKEIMISALESCRDVWAREKEASLCTNRAYSLVDGLVKRLRIEN